MKSFVGILAVILLLAGPVIACAENEAFGFIVTPENVYPGRLERISYQVPGDGPADLELVDRDGNVVIAILSDYHVAQGVHHLTWDGTDRAGNEAAPGEYDLRLSFGGRNVSAFVRVNEPIPKLTRVQLPDVLMPGTQAQVLVEASRDGKFSLSITGTESDITLLDDAAVFAGENSLSFTVPENAPLGDVTLEAVIRSPSDIAGTARQMRITVEPRPTPTPVPTPVPTPTPYIPSKVTKIGEEDLNYWTLPIGDIEAEAAIWEVMTQPITVLSGDQKEVYKLRKEPDKSTAKDNIVGEITFASQGVHVLETRDDGWTKVEVYNSSYGPDCASRRGYGNTDELITGYVQTNLLKVIEPLTEYGLLIDKLEQKMYIFQDGKCIGSLLVSTGQPTDKQPWNETPSGEFLMVSRTGGFPAGNLWCEYGMRINGGCLIHEVPYIGNPDTPAANRDYSSTVFRLGTKASHGCVRVQKKENEEGQNIKWLWNNIKLNTKVLIWDDTGRWIPYPDDDTVVYYNPTGGKYFHQDQYCSSVKSRYLPLTPTTYGELEELFEKPTACKHCVTIKTKAEIDALNALINPDPVP